MIAIHTDRLTIRESSGRDFSRIYAMLLSEAAGASMVYDVTRDEDEELEKFLAYIHTVYSVFGFGLWSVVLNDGGEVIGWCGLQPIGDETSPLGRIELGYLIDRDYRGKGFGYEACRAILDLAFGKLELEEVFARIAEGNVPSVRLARSLGFVRLRGDLWVAESR